jgi:hypothetical protein
MEKYNYFTDNENGINPFVCSIKKSNSLNIFGLILALLRIPLILMISIPWIILHSFWSLV